jgi:hypothetical protein
VNVVSDGRGIVGVAKWMQNRVWDPGFVKIKRLGMYGWVLRCEKAISVGCFGPKNERTLDAADQNVIW